jgi:catechol O-methyltransferase
MYRSQSVSLSGLLTPQYNDGRETELLTHMFSLPNIASLRSSPSAVLREIDLYAQKHYLMNIGELKGNLVTTLLNQHRPMHSLELGGYIGYSALLFGSTVKAWGGRYTVIEHNPVFAGVIMVLCSLAGLDNVDIVVGSSTDEIKRLWKEGKLGKVEGGEKMGLDFVFMDHLKPLYTDDLMVMEELGVVRKGTIVVGDNMIKPGNPRYRKYVEMSKEDRKKEGCKGWWKSECVKSWEPQGVPVS